MPNFAKFSDFNRTRNQNLHIESIFSEFFKPKAVNLYFFSALTETPYIKRNWRTLFGKFLAYMYLFIAYGFMTLYFSYNIRIAVKPLGFMAILLITIGAYFLYFVINHILIRLVISHKTLIIFDLLALIMLVCIAISDFWLSK